MSIGNSSDGNVPEDDRTSPEDDLISIGRALREARIAAGLTLDQISSRTRVRVPIVEAIEKDDFSRCGGDVYARGHIRALARESGTDPEPLVAQFDADRGRQSTPTPATPLFEAERIRPDRRRPNWTAAMVAAIVAVVGFVGFTAFHNDGDSSGGTAKDTAGKPAAGAPTPSASHVNPSPTATTPSPTPSDSAIAAAPHDKVTVKLSAVGDKSWISAKAHNGKMLYSGTLYKGQSRTVQDDHQVDLVIGDAGAIELYVNGKKVDNQFERGQVERVSYTQGDPTDG